MLRSLPSSHHDHGLTIITGKRAYAFQADQIEVLVCLAQRLLELDRSLASGTLGCRFASMQKVNLRKPLFPALFGLLAPSPRPTLRCFSCNFCKNLLQVKESLGLKKTLDIRRLAYAVSPQILPSNMKGIGSARYRVEPFSINLLEAGGSPVYIPILDGLKLADRVRIFDMIRRVRVLEWRSLPSPISLELSDIIEQRRDAIMEMGGLSSSLLPFAAYSSVGLANMFPLLMDDHISEFFVDRESSLAYLDHRDFGRCNSSLCVGKTALKHLLTFARMALGKTIDYQSPSLRASLKTLDFNIRISVDAPPLSLEGTSASVRKFFMNPITLQELVSNSTLTPEAAEYLVHNLRSRKCLTVYGESGSGKTTLAVALDLLTPSFWRKISVESDVAENVTQSRFGKHQIRLLASSATKPEQERRALVLNSLLHKSPDYIFFGEVLSKEDSVSLFQILAAGLKCIHTIHAESAESLFRRWVCQHDIPAQSLRDLDVLVEMRKRCSANQVSRRIYRISEVEKETQSELPKILDVFRWDEGSGMLMPTADYGGAVLRMEANRCFHSSEFANEAISQNLWRS